MKNKLYLLLFAVLSCFVFVACGEEEGNSAEMETYEYDNSGDVTISNGLLSLTVSGSSTQIEVKDEKTGKHTVLIRRRRKLKSMPMRMDSIRMC